MERKDFFTEGEIRIMRERIIRECCFKNFLVAAEYTDEDGTRETYKTLAPEVKSIIRVETDKQIKEYVKIVIDEVVKDKIKIAVENFTKNLCDQLEKITAKTNWYWSIK